MSILHAKTRMNPMLEMEIAAAEITNVTQEGMAMQFAGYENGKRKIRPSNGTADTEFVGFNFGVPLGAPSRFTKIELLKFVTDGAGNAKVVLSRAPITGTILVMLNSTGWGTGSALAEITTGTPTAGQYIISNTKELLTNVANLDANIFVVYQYAPTLLEARAKYGELLPGVSPLAVTGSMSVIVSGYVYTDMYDTSKNWSDVDTINAGETLKAGANGRVTYGGSAVGASMAGLCSIIELPTVDQPYLGLWVKVD